MSRTLLFRVYLAIFTQFFCDFHTSFFADPIKSERTHILDFSTTNSYFQGIFCKIPGQFQDKIYYFSNSRSFPGPRSNSRTFPGLCKPTVKAYFNRI